jgi:hypothetical protein
MNFFPKITAPYYIWAPPWTCKSSGVKALHFLCHALNESGQKAYLTSGSGTLYAVNPGLNTPMLTPEHHNFYLGEGIDPIAVYPDIVNGNPLAAGKAVRWLLAPAGKHGGDTTFPSTDKVYGYTKDIHENVLCLPAYDTSIFYPPPAGSTRFGVCFYSHKYDRIHGNVLPEYTKEMPRCEGTPQQLAEILRTHECCYVFERSEVMILAKLCGCDVFLTGEGYWDCKYIEEFFDENQDLVPLGVSLEKFEDQLQKFIAETQQWNG